MKIERFYDINLAHASYAIFDKGEIALIDPARNPQQYYEFAVKNNAKIKAVIETHPHADFVSSHLEICRETNARIYASKLVGASYPFTGFDDGDEIKIGNITLKAINTPGHSPDSISILLVREDKKEEAIFTGDTLFIGDVGRPDLRENAGNTTAKREALAQQMYETIRDKFKDFGDELTVYPAHGAGSLCGKNLSHDASSTMGKERKENWAFKVSSREEFINTLLKDQPFIPKYFGFDVDLNKNGAPGFEKSIYEVKRISDPQEIPPSALVVDVRNEKSFKEGHLPNSINIMLTEKGKFETWLGAIVGPSEEFYLVAADEEQREKAIGRAAKIGYENQIPAALSVGDAVLPEKSDEFDLDKFRNDPDAYSIVDIRNHPEINNGKYFKNAIVIPLYELRENSFKIPKDKPVVVHCAAGYRSAAGSSILENQIKDVEIYDLGDAINQYK